MPIDNTGAGYRRLAGLYERLIADQQAAVVRPDLRLLNLTLEDPDAIRADRAAVTAEAKAHPKRSALLDKLLVGDPVIIERTDLHGRLSADGPTWLLEGRGYLRVYADDLVEPADGPADQRQY
jgi:hypothetical protein